MNYLLHFFYPVLPFICGLIISFALWYRLRFYTYPTYRYSLISSLLAVNSKFVKTNTIKKIVYILRVSTLGILALLIGRPQLIDKHSKISIEGIDIMLVLDVSGSMSFSDDLQDRRSRIEVAVKEAQDFIEKRENDPVGLVFFGSNAVVRSPLTLDKKLLKDMLYELKIGIVDPNETMLLMGVATAASAMRNSKAKSKVMIVLTDGNPSPGDLEESFVLDIVKKLGIKMYTIGIGSKEGAIFDHPLFGIIREYPLNTDLLERLAKETGGTFFSAQHPEDMKKIYKTINNLEKTELEKPLYSRYYELGEMGLLLVLFLLFCEIALTYIIWKIL